MDPAVAAPSDVQLEPCEEPTWALVVDADVSSRAQIGHALAALSYHVVSVDSLASARAELLRHQGAPSVVVLDSDTPHALALVSVLRRRLEVPVLVSGRRGTGFIRHVDADVDGFLAKPVDLSASIAELRATTRRAPAQRLAIRQARRSLAGAV